VIQWPELVEQHGPDVWRTVYRLLNNYDDASDCYQEAFLHALSYSQQRQVKCWAAMLRRIATSRAMDLLRRRYRASATNTQLSILDAEPASVGPSPDVSIQLRESIDQLRGALAEIPALHAEVFWLSEVEKLSHQNIAEQLEVTPRQVALWLHRAKQKLRKLLALRGVTNEMMR
jgi:RNA polymerase sigma-70 factor (ECF subfamily)